MKVLFDQNSADNVELHLSIYELDFNQCEMLYTSMYYWKKKHITNHVINKILVGISATMCHSAEKIPAKEGCQSLRVSKKQQSYPSRVFK